VSRNLPRTKNFIVAAALLKSKLQLRFRHSTIPYRPFPRSLAVSAAKTRPGISRKTSHVLVITATLAVCIAPWSIAARGDDTLVKAADLVGRWDCVDTRTNKKVRMIEFKNDGTYMQVMTSGEFLVASNGGNYEVVNGVMSFFVDVSASPVTTSRNPDVKSFRSIFERGELKRIDGNLLTYRMTAGSGAAGGHPGRVYELHHLDAMAGRGKEGSIFGVWVEIDSRAPHFKKQVELRRDHTYEERGLAGRQIAQDEMNFQYDAPILLVTVHDRNQNRDWPVRSGKVLWTDADHFTFEILNETRPVLNLPPGKITFSRIAQTQPARAQNRAQRDAPGGERGDLRGLWQCFDKNDRQVRVVEFGSDGSCTETVKGNRTYVRRYRVDNDTLEIVNREPIPRIPFATEPPNLPPAVRERLRHPDRIVRGRVEWLDGDLFAFTVLDGAAVGPFGEHQEGSRYEFHRMGVAVRAKPGSLIGVWEQIEPKDDQRVGTIEFKRDRTCKHLGGIVQNGPHDFYSLENGVLTITYEDGFRKLVLFRGTITWEENNNELVFTVSDGARVADVPGKSYRMRRN
jgi:hypothetical protein